MVVVSAVVVVIIGDVVVVVIVVISIGSNSHEAAEDSHPPLSPPRVQAIVFAAAWSDGREGPGQECRGRGAPQTCKSACHHRNQIQTTLSVEEKHIQVYNFLSK